jgi:hypothetical protein
VGSKIYLFGQKKAIRHGGLQYLTVKGLERECRLRKFSPFSLENARDHHFLCIINPIYDFFMKFRDPKIYAVEIHSKDPLRKVSSPFEYLYEYSIKDGWYNGSKQPEFAKKMSLSEASMFISTFSKMYPEFFHITLIKSYNVPVELGKNNTIVLESAMNSME